MGLGPLMVDIEGVELDAADRDLLAHPSVGGVILFSRNYVDPQQLLRLTASIHALRSPQLLIAVDHEGGRVQRFRDGFTRLPAAGLLGQVYERDSARGLQLAAQAGWLMAAELCSCGVDMSFAPVLDLDRGNSQVIGDRAFHRRADVVITLARASVHGMRDAGMAAVGKHFPGHGGVADDSHQTLPVDPRDLASFEVEDMMPFERLAGDGLPGIMTAHLMVPAVDAQPVSFSHHWLTTLLRRALGYRGAVFSDDLSMHGAHGVGTPLERALAALAAGCDMALLCNDRAAAEAVADSLHSPADAVRASRLARFHNRGAPAREQLESNPRHVSARSALAGLDPAPELDLHDDNPA